MKLPTLLVAGPWLIRDTWRQSLASGIFWILLGISAVSVLVCLSIQVDDTTLAPDGETADFLPRRDPDSKDASKVAGSGVAVASGQLRFAFGAIQMPIARDAHQAVHYLQLILAGGVADTLGLLLALVWTAGFLPTFLEPRSISVLIAKPAPRWCLFLGKYAGVLTFMLMYATVFVGGTWLAIGWRTGVWDTSYLLSVPVLLLHFAIFFSVSALLAVFTRSTVVCVFGSIMFWALAWGMNYGHHALQAATNLMPEGQISSRLSWISSAAYWMLPKPADFGVLLSDALDAGKDFAALPAMSPLDAHSSTMLMSVVSSLVFAGCVLVASTRKFSRTDY